MIYKDLLFLKIINRKNTFDKADNRFFHFILYLCICKADSKGQESQKQRDFARGGKWSYPQSVASRTVRALWKAVARLPNDSVKLPQILERRGDSRFLGIDSLHGRGPTRDNSIFFLMTVTAVKKSTVWHELFFCHNNDGPLPQEGKCSVRKKVYVTGGRGHYALLK